MKEFHVQLKRAMAQRNVTQRELCEKTGIPKSALSQYVSGAFKPKQERVFLIAKALKVNEAWLMGFDNVLMDRDSQNSYININVTSAEANLIIAYRGRPEMQSAVNCLLGISNDDDEKITVYKAARSTDDVADGFTDITKDQLKRLQNAPIVEDL